MSKVRYFRVAVMIAATLGASGCSTGLFKRGKAAGTPVIGKRIAVLTSEGDAEIDLATSALPMA